MAMKRCPDCGEKYSDTYKRCPFCEEEAALRGKQPVRRRKKGGYRSSQTSPSMLSPILIVVIIALAGLLLWLLFGDAIGKDKQPGSSAVTSSQQSSVSAEKPTVSGSGSDSSQAGASSAAPSGGQTTAPTDVSGLPNTLTLNKTDFTIPVGDPPVKLTASGGSGQYTWISSDEGVASVDETGKVVAISAGTATITATDGNGKGECIVRVKAGTGVPNTGSSVSSGSGSGTHTLNREDFTLPKSDPPFQLKVSGVTSGITWSSSNTSVATVDADGVVRAVGAGNATITASFNGQSLTCIVRVPG